MNKMIISPHVDDEILGCGGMLDENTFVLHCGCAENQQHGHKALTRAERIDEFCQVADEIHLSFHLLHHPVNINNVRPDQIYIPHPSYNQDHRAVYEACLTALRPHDINFFVKKVLIYEQPHVAFWSHNYRAFQPNHFKPIDIEKKNHLYSMIATQVRSFRSPAHVRAIAAMRGAQSNCEYAEAFEIIRWID